MQSLVLHNIVVEDALTSSLVVLAQGNFQNQDWDTHEEKCKHIRNEERASAIVVDERWETPHISLWYVFEMSVSKQ